MTNEQNQAGLPQTRDPFQTILQRFFGDSLADFYQPSDVATTPRTNISETDHSYELAFELPGISEQDIQVQMQDKTLTVTAERKDDRETKGKRWHRTEHRYGRYTRSILLPQDSANDGIEAVYRNGLLTVVVPKLPESRPAKIQVRSA